MRPPCLLRVALLLLALGASGCPRAVLAGGGGTVAVGGAAGGGATGSAPSDGAPAGLLRNALVSNEQHGAQLIGEQAGSGSGSSAAAAGEAQPTEEELAAAALFQHPLAPPEQQRNWRAGAQTHVEMQRWLRRFFARDASRLTSTRLQAAQMAAAASGGRGPAVPLAVGEAGDVLATAGGSPCNATCARKAAEELLVGGEAPGHGFMPLVWPQFPEDKRRWAAVRTALNDSTAGDSSTTAGSESTPAAASGSAAGANRRTLAEEASSSGSTSTAADSSMAHASVSEPVTTCLPRRPGEAITKDYLVVAAVGNDLTTINRCAREPSCGRAVGCVICC